MKKTTLHLTIISSARMFLFYSCRKETSCEGCSEANKPPIAIAGSDQVITLPTDSISLDGCASSDPDGTISEWLWSKISSPACYIAGGAIDGAYFNLSNQIWKLEFQNH